MIVSSITFDDLGYKLRVHRPKGFAFLHHRGVIIGQFFYDSRGDLRFRGEKGGAFDYGRLIQLFAIVRSML